MDVFDLVRILQVVFGIGLVIFVHEAGHFLAARWCGVRVQVFSLGFGPPLFTFVRGGTTYQVAIVPLGGYVKMAGDEPTAEGREWARREERRLRAAEGGSADPGDIHGELTGGFAAPREGDLHSKSIPQRFLIYSGGVIMNLAFGAVVFPILFANGVPFTDPILDPAPGGPAWRAHVPAGSRALEVNGEPVYDFLHVLNEVALGDPSRTDLRFLPPGETEPREVTLTPEVDEGIGIYSIGVDPSPDRSWRIDVAEDSPAHAAGLRSGMQLVGAVGATPGQDPRRQLFEVLGDGGRAQVLARTDDSESLATYAVEPVVSDEVTRTLLGISPAMNLVRAVRENPDLEALGVREGDYLESVNGRRILESGDLARALAEHDGPITVRARRGAKTVDLSAPALESERALRLAADMAIGQDLEGTEIVVTDGWAASDAGIRDGDIIRYIDGEEVSTWTAINERVQAAGKEGLSLRFAIARFDFGDPGGAPLELELEAAPREEALSIYYGISVRKAEYVFRADGPVDALQVGLLCSWRMVEDTWLTLKRMVSGEVSSKHIGGIITISRMSYSWSEQGLAKLFFFLCMLSINLAILNVLPIPVLDGGHLMFLLIEKIKGSPPSDRFLGYSQMVGLVLILSLLVYVTYNDLVRAFPRLFNV